MDRELARRCARREPQAWAELVRRAEGVIRRVLPESEDLRQEVWVRLLAHDCRALRSVRANRPGALAAFVRAVARSVALDHLRAQRRAVLVPREPFTQDAEASNGRVRRLLDAAAQRSAHPARDRDILRLHFEEGFGPAEIAAMGIVAHRDAAESVLRRMRARLGRLIGEQAEDGDVEL
jgi:DNA-directed RNA polymerase specialized sigma24 family protein